MPLTILGVSEGLQELLCLGSIRFVSGKMIVRGSICEIVSDGLREDYQRDQYFQQEEKAYPYGQDLRLSGQNWSDGLVGSAPRVPRANRSQSIGRF